jgi:hypothetical protein
MYKSVINALNVPTVEELSAGKLPFVLLRWPKGLAIPEAIRQKMDEKGIIGMPTCNLNLPWTGGAVAKFKEVSVAMAGGQRFSIGLDFDPAAIRLTGSAEKPYFQLDPTAVYLNKIEEVEPVWTGATGTAEDDDYAKLLNKAVSEATRARLAARRTTTSGTPIVDDSADTEETSPDDKEF